MKLFEKIGLIIIFGTTGAMLVLLILFFFLSIFNPESYYNQNKKQDQYFKQTKYGKYEHLNYKEIEILIETDRIKVLREIRNELKKLNKED